MSDKPTVSRYVPQVKVMGGTAGAYVGGFVIDILQGRFDVVLQPGEINFILAASMFVVAYLIPEPAQRSAEQVITQLQERVQELQSQLRIGMRNGEPPQ